MTTPANEAQDTSSKSRPALPATIVWGIILLAFAALCAAPILFDVNFVESPRLLAWGFTGLGVVVVLVGLVTALRRRR